MKILAVGSGKTITEALINRGDKKVEKRLIDYCIESVIDVFEDTGLTADVQPVRYGEWEIFYQNGKPKLKCTNCYSLFDIRTNDKHICIYPKFCEECGARMAKEGNTNGT